MAALVFSLVGCPTVAFSMTVSLAAPVVEVLWMTVRGASGATGVRGSPEGSPAVTAWAGAGAPTLPVTNSFKFLQFFVGGLVVEPWCGALGGIASGPGAVSFVGTYWWTDVS